MKSVIDKNPLPESYTGHPDAKGVVLESLIPPTNGSKLRLLLLVFDTQKNLQHFHDYALGMKSRGNSTRNKMAGCVLSLSRIMEQVPSGERHAIVQPRIFSIMCLYQRELTMRVITHECVHAAFDYHARISGAHCYPYTVKDLPNEERIAYPAGDIAGRVVAALRQAEILP